jgi:phosphohistidine phosphatase
LRTLLLMRHAKSDWNASFRTDHDRPLSARGRSAADAMGVWLRRAAEPDAIVSSPAVRARTTAERAIAAGELEATMLLEPAIYEASARSLLRVSASLPDDARVAMLVGHEPGMSSLIALLTGETVRFPTAAVARIDLRIDDWAEIAPMCGTLALLQLPRDL